MPDAKTRPRGRYAPVNGIGVTPRRYFRRRLRGAGDRALLFSARAIASYSTSQK